ncbi:creatininase family protein [Candidatus Entotheonella palauensis]|uniref:creatininase family protein n=1 Tax=Candidatus Entotheonella palauensis TaxID=93172 RepID=UPI000B7D915F|nr:creatininase family protein [Candidatus Entotheonella palauensis]
MKDALNTFSEIAQSDIDLAILPIGATEQHGSYLPLSTDSLEAEAVARGVAERLDAFMLPVLPFSNSEAHAGFRGSISLSPTTLLAVVKELALDLMGQGFRRVVLLNMHGGNLILRPAVREINQHANTGRAIVVQPFSLAATALSQIFPNYHHEAHAGGFEASLIMTIAPDTIKGTAADAVPDAPLEAFDYLPMSCLSPSGIWGEPSQASRERGERALEVMIEQTTTHTHRADVSADRCGTRKRLRRRWLVGYTAVVMKTGVFHGCTRRANSGFHTEPSIESEIQ